MGNEDTGSVPEVRTGSGIETRKIDPGRYIFREHESGDTAFIVKSGTVELFITIDDKQVHISDAIEGEMFGEMALIDDSPRMASAKAKTPVILMAISKPVFDRKLKAMDPFTRNLVTVLADYIRTTTGSYANYVRNRGRPVEEKQDEG